MLSVDLYRGEDALRSDREQVLRRTWQFMGHVSQIPAAGDYLADVIGGAPVVGTRTSTSPCAIRWRKRSSSCSRTRQ